MSDPNPSGVTVVPHYDVDESQIDPPPDIPVTVVEPTGRAIVSAEEYEAMAKNSQKATTVKPGKPAKTAAAPSASPATAPPPEPKHAEKPAEPAVSPDDMRTLRTLLMSVLSPAVVAQAAPPPSPAPAVAAPTPQIRAVPPPTADTNMPFLTPTPSKPAVNVVFSLGETAGNLMLKYHAVVVDRQCMVLVYDTRYEDGLQYMPPDLSEHPDPPPATLHVTWVGNSRAKSFTVALLGLSFRLGCLDCTVLPFVSPPQEDNQS